MKFALLLIGLALSVGGYACLAINTDWWVVFGVFLVMWGNRVEVRASSL